MVVGLVLVIFDRGFGGSGGGLGFPGGLGVDERRNRGKYDRSPIGERERCGGLIGRKNGGDQSWLLLEVEDEGVEFSNSLCSFFGERRGEEKMKVTEIGANGFVETEGKAEGVRVVVVRWSSPERTRERGEGGCGGL
ncbi:hypothetical protein HAX54_039906, partial [Datura stramonium]|nr:hypothetical protein [Datura stramonium]